MRHNYHKKIRYGRVTRNEVLDNYGLSISIYLSIYLSIHLCRKWGLKIKLIIFNAINSYSNNKNKNISFFPRHYPMPLISRELRKTWHWEVVLKDLELRLQKQFGKSREEFIKVNESRYKQCGVNPNISKIGQNLLKKILRKDKYWQKLFKRKHWEK